MVCPNSPTWEAAQAGARARREAPVGPGGWLAVCSWNPGPWLQYSGPPVRLRSSNRQTAGRQLREQGPGQPSPRARPPRPDLRAALATDGRGARSLLRRASTPCSVLAGAMRVGPCDLRPRGWPPSCACAVWRCAAQGCLVWPHPPNTLPVAVLSQAFLCFCRPAPSGSSRSVRVKEWRWLAATGLSKGAFKPFCSISLPLDRPHSRAQYPEP